MPLENPGVPGWRKRASPDGQTAVAKPGGRSRAGIMQPGAGFAAPRNIFV
jgi:hypothetical protein